jgi:hydrogenase-4 component E
MISVLLITFLITLFYMAIANRLRTYINVLAVQGVLLFFVVFIQLSEINTLNLVLILLETIVFKSVAVPAFLSYLLRRNNITRKQSRRCPISFPS